MVQPVRTTLEAQWLHKMIHWVDQANTPAWAEFTHTIVTLRQSSQRHLQNYNHISFFLQPHKRYERHVHIKLVYDKEHLRTDQGERVQDEHADHAVWYIQHGLSAIIHRKSHYRHTSIRYM